MLSFHTVCHELLDIIGVPKTNVSLRLQDAAEPVMNLAQQLRINYYLGKWLLRTQSDSLDHDMQTLISQQLIINKTRNAMLRDQIIRLAEMLRNQSIPVLFLKGAAGLLYGMYDIECRYLSDIDMLIPEKNISEAQAFLISEGYIPEHNTEVPENHHHIIPYYHTGNVGGLEIHHEPYSMSMLDRPAMPDIWDDAVTLTIGDSHIMVPSLNDHAWITMRSEALTSVYIPCMKETTELAETVQFGHVDFETMRKRASREDMPGLVQGYTCSLMRLFEIYLPFDCDTSYMRSWRLWSRRQKIRMLKDGDRLKASRTRFGAVRFLSPKGLAGKIRLNSRIIRYDIEHEQTTNRCMIGFIYLKNFFLHLFWLVDCALICMGEKKEN